MTPPDDPDDQPLRRRGLGLAFWVAMAFGLICILAGVTVARYGPSLFPAHATRQDRPDREAPIPIVASPLKAD